MTAPVVSLVSAPPRAELHIHRESTLNALNEEVLSALSSELQKLQVSFETNRSDACPRVLIVRSDGEKAFVAGADIKLMQAASPIEFQRYVVLGQRVMRQIELLPIPVICRAQGFALGGGMELALACDFIVASDSAKFGQPEVNLGLIPGFGGSQRLAARIGRARTKRLVFTGETLGAPEALAMGVVDYVVPAAELDQKIDDLVAVFAAKPAPALAAAKRAVDAYFDPQLRSGLLSEMEEFLAVSSTSDAREGLSAFVEKRKPKFGGS